MQQSIYCPWVTAWLMEDDAVEIGESVGSDIGDFVGSAVE